MFYKRADQELFCADTGVYAPGYILLAEEHASYTYPVDGWYWFDTLDEAMSALRAAPQSVTKRQARQALILMGKDEFVVAALDAIPGIPGKMARAEWQDSNVIERHRPLVAQMGNALGMSPAQIDELFILAATL